MQASRETLILTGASGIVGRGFLAAARDRYLVYAIARRSQAESGVPNHPNVRWIQVDIGNGSAVERVSANIARRGGADYLVHLAAHYDFENVDSPEFQRTNIDGTRHVLEMARRLAIRQLVFASSVAACDFPPAGGAVDEESPPDADFPYARSKRVGEEMVREYSRFLPAAVVRLAAVFSDWCEYAPLYVFLSTWLSRRWNARILAGRGASAVPYIHIRDVCRFFLLLLDRERRRPAFRVYCCSPDGATGQVELFERARRFHFAGSPRPIFVPAALARPGLLARDLAGRLVGRRPFERAWMLDYVDRRLTIDAARTRRETGWAPTPRFHVSRRLLFLIEKMRSRPYEWELRNQRAMKRVKVRPGLVIHDAMMEARDAIVDAITAYLRSPVREGRFPTYSRVAGGELRWSVGLVYDLLTAGARTGDRTLLLEYIDGLARRRQAAGFPESEVCDALFAISEVVVEELGFKPEVVSFRQEVRDCIVLSIGLAIDGVQDAYDEAQSASLSAEELVELDRGEREVEAIVGKLNAFYRPADGLSNGAGSA